MRNKLIPIVPFIIIPLVLKVFMHVNSVENQIIIRYIGSAFALAIIVLYCLFDKIIKNCYIDKFMVFLGDISLEIYLIHVALIGIGVNTFDLNNFILYVLLIVISVVLSVAILRINRDVIYNTK